MKVIIDAVERHLWKVVAIIVLLIVVTHWSSISEFSSDVKVVTSCRPTACGFDR